VAVVILGGSVACPAIAQDHGREGLVAGPREARKEIRGQKH
jgi:hypothetical protein